MLVSSSTISHAFVLSNSYCKPREKHSFASRLNDHCVALNSSSKNTTRSIKTKVDLHAAITYSTIRGDRLN